GAGAAGYEEVGTGQDAGFDEADGFIGEGAEANQVGGFVGVARKLTNRQDWPVEGNWGDHGVDTATVPEPCIGHRAAEVDPAAHRADDEVDHTEEVVVVLEESIRE